MVVYANSALRRQVQPWLRRFKADQLYVISASSAPEWLLNDARAVHLVGESPREIHGHLKLLGPVDVMIDLTARDLAAQIDTWRRLMFHLRPGGAYVIDQSTTTGNAFGRTAGDWLAKLLAAEELESSPGAPRRNSETIRAIGGVTLTRDLVLVTKREHHLLKLNDAETNRVLASREPGVRVEEMATKPGGMSPYGARMFSHFSAVDLVWPASPMRYPPLHLRHYRGRIGYAGNTLMFTENSVLPDSFRHHLGVNPDNPRMVNVSPSFARIPDNVQPREVLEGDFYQIDSAYSRHFGHVMTEVVSRLWGWDAAKDAMPGLKAVLRSNVPLALNPMFERKLFNAYGIDDADIVYLEDPVALESVVAATPMWHNSTPHYVHPDIRQTFDRLGDALIDPAAARYDKIFISRSSRSPRRTCRNVGAVEDFFAQRGFTVIYPETLPLGIQAGIFAQARVIAGFGGSAMFNVMFARSLQTLVLLSHEAYSARNEYLFTSLMDCEVHYFWSPPDIPHPKNGWSLDAFYSDWEFDFDRNGRELDEMLSSL